MGKKAKGNKMKTRKAAAKRFKVTRGGKGGKVMRRKCGSTHLMSAKSPKRRRALRRSAVVPPCETPKALKMLRSS